jgi:hypothetical protein
MIDLLRAPLVTDIDKQWALDQCPAFAYRSKNDVLDDGDGEIVDETPFERSLRLKAKPDLLDWDWYVEDQIARFQRFFCHERKTFGDWSRLWRRSWWPKADPAILSPRYGSKEPHPFVRRGDPGYAAALAVATPDERRVFERIGIVQFKPDDPRAKVLNHKESA